MPDRRKKLVTTCGEFRADGRAGFRYKGTIPQDASIADSPVPAPSAILRWIFWGLLALYCVAAVGLLGLRYWVLPRADEWRPRIVQYASEELGARVSVDHLSANWRGLNPRLKLEGVRIHTADGPVLTLPSVSAVLAWRSVLQMSPALLSLQIDGADIALRRDVEGRFWVAGQALDLDGGPGDSPWLLDLERLRELSLHDTTVRWLDEARGAPEIALRKLDLLVRNGRLSHRFSLRAQPPPELAASLVLRGELNRGVFSGDPHKLATWSGQLYAELGDAEPQAWRPWLDIPLVQGRMAARAWWQIEKGQLAELTLDAAARGLGWREPGQASLGVAVRDMSGRLQGAPGDLLQLPGLPLMKSPEGTGLSLTMQAREVQAHLPGLFEQPDLSLNEIDLDSRFDHPAGQPLRMNLGQLRLANEDLELRLYGDWRAEGKTPAGSADLRGALTRAHMNAIHRYLPLEVNADAREWLAIGLPAGEISDAAITIRGDLEAFPYSAEGAQGVFRLAGKFSDATVDYAPAGPGRKAWPRLEKLGGSFVIDKASLALDSPGGGRIPTGPQQWVTLGAISARIPDMEHDSTLFVDGVSSGPVPAYLALAANSPLGGLLDDALSEASGTGDWRVPLKLEVPLLNAEDTSVQGQILFAGNSFRFMPDIPVMDQIHGALDFSEQGIEVKDIKGQFLGGPARIWGKMQKGSEPLQFEGTLAGNALTQVINARAMTRFSGKTAYRGRLVYQRGGSIDISVRSDLTGMAINMPAPVGKRAQTALPLALQWSPATDAGSRNRRWLTGSLGENINVLLERDQADKSGSYFARGALGINRAATLPGQGLSLAASLPELDMPAWDKVLDEFDQPAIRSAVRKNAQPTMPDLRQVNLATARLRTASLDLTDLKLFAQRPAPSQWRVDLASHQATGMLEWTEASGAIAGHIVARLKHLSLGEASDGNPAKASPASGNDLSDLPAIDLQAQHFSLYGKPLGELQLLGTNTEVGHRWRLDKLQIRNDDATLNATGEWRLAGEQRGLTVQAKAEFKDAGKFLGRVGLKQVMSGGSGSVEANLSWRNLPWTHSLVDISGHASLSLEKGRFLSVNSRTARLLELLSFQSLQRIAKLDFNPANLLRDGFPFDTVSGEMALERGVLKTEGYKVNGPVAAIVLAGNTNIISERWDLKAVVVPNLDASGAAVATAALVNPLIGLGAFVTQWLLKQPLARAMTLGYKVTGSWDEPKVEPVQLPNAPAPKFETSH
ncbi:TIGR02099 family protein [Bordetella avium]|nr:TIGR02099 family protein [Bordetella avium]